MKIRITYTDIDDLGMDSLNVLDDKFWKILKKNFNMTAETLKNHRLSQTYHLRD